MFWLLSRALCCLCSKRQSLSNLNRDGGHYSDGGCYSDEDGDEDDDTDSKVRARAVELSNLKRNAIDVTTDVIVAENLLKRHGNDSSLLMYHDKCFKEMCRILNKLPVTPHGPQVKRPYRKLFPNGNGARYTTCIV